MKRISIFFENPKNDVNVPMIARTCDFFGITYYIGEMQQIKHKLSAGSTKRNPPSQLKLEDWKGRVIVTDSSYSVHPKDFQFQDGDLIVFGNECLGVSKKAKELACARIGIPSIGLTRCLNVAAAVSGILSIISVQGEFK